MEQAELITVVLADDHGAIRDGIRLRLMDLEGCRVVAEASTGPGAIEHILELAPMVAIIDVRMPEQDGFWVAEQARDAGIDTRIILFSAVRDPLLVERGFSAGASGFVSKDSAPATLCDAVRVVMDGRRYVDPELAVAMIDCDRVSLSTREHEILELLGDGLQNDAIALKLGISAETVKTHVSRIINKLDATSRTQAVANAFRRTLLG